MRSRLLDVDGININQILKVFTLTMTGFSYYICPVLITVILNKGWFFLARIKIRKVESTKNKTGYFRRGENIFFLYIFRYFSLPASHEPACEPSSPEAPCCVTPTQHVFYAAEKKQSTKSTSTSRTGIKSYLSKSASARGMGALRRVSATTLVPPKIIQEKYRIK